MYRKKYNGEVQRAIAVYFNKFDSLQFSLTHILITSPFILKKEEYIIIFSTFLSSTNALWMMKFISSQNEREFYTFAIDSFSNPIMSKQPIIGSRCHWESFLFLRLCKLYERIKGDSTGFLFNAFFE